MSAFVRRMLQGPLTALTEGTKRIGSGDLGYQIRFSRSGELEDLATSFNTMSSPAPRGAPGNQRLDAHTGRPR